MKFKIPVKRLGMHVKSQAEVLQEETGRVQHMMKQPDMQGLKGAKSWTMKHKGSPTKVK